MFSGENSIADMLRDAANEVLHANVPEGFEWVEEYQQYYSRDTRYFYDPNSSLFYNADTLTYYRFNEETYSYEIVECCQPTKWSSNGYRKRAVQIVGEQEFKKFNQDAVDICELVFGIIGKVVKEEHVSNPNSALLPTKKPQKPVDQLTAEDISLMISKRKRKLNDESATVFDSHTGEFIQTSSKQTCSLDENDQTDGESDADDEKEYVAGDERAILMQEERFDQPPCVRIVDKNKKLQIITISGGYIGSDRDCEVVLSNTLLPERCAEISYSEDFECYSIEKIDESCVLQVNSNFIKTGQNIDICHGDYLIISGERLDIHVHMGSNTCPSCEPGLFQPEQEEDNTIQAKYISGEIARRKNLKKIMKSYGITPDSNLSGPIRSKKPATGPSILNIQREPKSDDTYGNCAARPVSDAERRFPLPQSSTSNTPQNVASKPLDSGNVGFKLLKSMGWTEGKGLGKEKQGKIEPVATEIKNNRQGLGAGKEKPKTYKEAVLEKTKQRFNEKR